MLSRLEQNIEVVEDKVNSVYDLSKSPKEMKDILDGVFNELMYNRYLYNWKVNIDDIKTQPFIKITDKVGPRGPLGSKLEEYLLKNSLNLNPTFNTETYQVALALVSKGMGITITDKISAESSSHPNIKILELKPDLEFSLEIVYSKSNPLSLINKSFIGFLSNFEYHNDI